MSGVWSAEDTTPAAIEAALRSLLASEQQEGESPMAPARVLNLVAIVDREWKGEIANRLDGVGRYHPSRTLLIAVVWSPHGYQEAVNALLGLAQVVLLDSLDLPDPRAALQRAGEMAARAYVVDLAWLRSAPWRERIAATFDPPAWRPALRELKSVTVRHREGSEVSAALVVGWLASRLGWDPDPLEPYGTALSARARSNGHEVSLRLQPAGLDVPGLVGMSVETVSGMTLSLDRGAGGLTAKRRMADGRESSWVVLGTSPCPAARPRATRTSARPRWTSTGRAPRSGSATSATCRRTTSARTTGCS